MKIVAGICLFMAGSLPAAELLRRALSHPLRRLGGVLGLHDDSLASLLIGFVSVTPALAMFKKMDARGRTVTAAFLVCAASTLASHLGFTLSVSPEMMLPLLLTNLLVARSALSRRLRSHARRPPERAARLRFSNPSRPAETSVAGRDRLY